VFKFLLQDLSLGEDLVQSRSISSKSTLVISCYFMYVYV